VTVTDGVPTLLLAVAGLIVGVPIKGVVASYHRDRSIWPWPHCQMRDLNTRRPTLLSLVNPRIYPCCPHSGGYAPRPWAVELVTTIAFSIVGAPYVDEPLLLVVTLAESTVLVTVLFIDLELLLIPTPLVLVLVLLALTSAKAVPTKPALAGEPVKANVRSGNVISEIPEPTLETACPLQSRR